ncbi:MAG: Lrp/AsnC ligand binding domain-containing protein [Candidatus Freyarchaeota archaeon]
MAQKPDSKNKNDVEKERRYTAFVLIKAEGELREVIKGLRKIEGVKEAYPLIGEYNAIAKLEVESTDQIEPTAQKILNSIGPVKVAFTLNVQAPPPHIFGDIESRIRQVVGETGVVNPKYGGYEIQVINETMFPWLATFKTLLEYPHEIWISQKDNRIVITTKPPPI